MCLGFLLEIFFFIDCKIVSNVHTLVFFLVRTVLVSFVELVRLPSLSNWLWFP